MERGTSDGHAAKAAHHSIGSGKGERPIKSRSGIARVRHQQGQRVQASSRRRGPRIPLFQFISEATRGSGGAYYQLKEEENRLILVHG